MEIQGRKVQSVEKAMRLLDCLLAARKPLSLAELASMTAWPKSTIHALLLSMIPNGTVLQQEDNKYTLGSHLFELGCAAQRWEREKKIMQPHLWRLKEAAKESVYLGKREGDEILLIDGFESENPHKISLSVGIHMPLYATTQGKVILAYMPKSAYQKYARTCPFQQYAAQTITTIAGLNQCVREIRELGFAIEHGGMRTGVLSIAVPIFQADETCNFAISVVMRDIEGMRTRRIDDICQLLLQTSREITVALRQPDAWNGQSSL